LLPLAAASRGGTIDDIPAQALVAAGITLLQRSAPLVRALAGKRSAILLPTSPAFFVALAASEGRGAVLMNPLAAPRELTYQIRDSDVGAVFTIAALADRLPDTIPRVLLDDAPRTTTVIAGGTSRTIDLGSHFALELEGDPDAAGDPGEAAIVYTSAMHGRPLGAILTHRGLLANARATIDAGAVQPSETVLAALPFSHLFGFVVTGVAPLLAGAHVLTLSRYHPMRVIELIERGDVSMFVGVPSMYVSLLAAIERRARSFDAAALRLCLCGGAPLNPHTQDRWLAATGIELRQGYGLTEASPVALFNQPGSPNVRGTLGRPYPGVDVSVRDLESFATLPDGTTGEICVRGAGIFPGYVRARNAAEPRGLEVRDGWLRTGDLGHRRDDGVFVFDGVAKSMFTRNGFNIYPREIERAVAELPGVASVSVHAVPDPLHENDIALTVTGSATEAEIRSWCGQRLSLYKQPATVTVVATR
jgi:long-chain acyl-CoA synthetase